MPYVSKPLSEVPKRAATRHYDEAAAQELLTIVQGPVNKDGSKPTASDDVIYAEAEFARTAANAARRLLLHVLPEKSYNVVSSVYHSEGGYRWAVYLAEYNPRAPRGSKKKSVPEPESPEKLVTDGKKSGKHPETAAE